MRRKLVAEVRDRLAQTRGMFVCGSPTVSGRTETFYACMQEINDGRKTIVAVEDVIAYRRDGIRQVEIDAGRGQTFAGILPSIVRQHPDVLAISEIRDRETAAIACDAATNGQRILATVQAGDAVTALFRMLELGVEPKAAASALTAVLAQRHVRLLCDECKEPYKPSPDFLKKAHIPADTVDVFFRASVNPARACRQCGGVGYLGRASLYELLVVTDPIREILRGDPSPKAIKTEARKGGMIYIQEDGLARVIQGKTSIQELLRALN